MKVEKRSTRKRAERERRESAKPRKQPRKRTFEEVLTRSEKNGDVPKSGPRDEVAHSLLPGRENRFQAHEQLPDPQHETTRRQLEESGAVFGSDGSLEDRAPSEAPVAVQLDRATEMRSTAAQPTQAPGRPRNAEVEELVGKLVEKLQASDDARKRKTLVLHLDAGERGRVAVRLSRNGDGFDLRMRPTNPAFARTLEAQQGDLRRSAAKRGLRFTQIHVVK